MFPSAGHGDACLSSQHWEGRSGKLPSNVGQPDLISKKNVVFSWAKSPLAQCLHSRAAGNEVISNDMDESYHVISGEKAHL